jgi:UPF0755 protein
MPLMKKYLLIIVLLVVTLGVSAVIIMYDRIWRNNVSLLEGEEFNLFIPTGSGFEEVFETLKSNDILLDTSSFRWVAMKKNYPRHVYPGRYILHGGTSNDRLVNMLRSGSQEPVQLVFNNIRSVEDLAGTLAEQIEADSAGILGLFSDTYLLEENGLSHETAPGIFIPNTYEIYWNTSTEELFQRMIREYRIFWNEGRLASARRIGLKPMEVITLASIVDEECHIREEEPVIAGVYINRLNRRMRLQADPTVRYAAGDMNMARVLKKHLLIDSQYNTYRHGGLPPGPIVIPSISAIDAVLEYDRHDYLYFCAKEDFSGYHNFAATLAQHNENARSYQKALNRRKIFN